MVRILVTGFAPFAHQPLNASSEVLTALSDTVAETAVLPVVYGRATEALLRAIERVDPRAVVLLGQANGAAELRVERLAQNLVTCHAPDEQGVVAIGTTAVSDAPTAYETSLPIELILSRLASVGIPAVESGDAGGYVCNHVFYSLMHRLVTERQHTIGGLVHLPCIPEQAADAGAPAMARETQVRAIAELVSAVAEVVCHP